jgi:hypothetical protein
MTTSEEMFRRIVLLHASRLGYTEVDIKQNYEAKVCTLGLTRPDQPDLRSVTVFAEDVLASVHRGELLAGVRKNIEEACRDPLEDRKLISIPHRALPAF